METEMVGILLGVVLPLYPMLFAIYQKIGKYDEIVESSSNNSGPNIMPTKRTKIVSHAVAKVTGLYRAKFTGL